MSSDGCWPHPVSTLLGLPPLSSDCNALGALFVATTSSVLDTLFATVMTLPSTKALLLREYKNGYARTGTFS